MRLGSSHRHFVIFGLGAMGVVVSSGAVAGDWRQVQGDAARTGVNSAERLGELAPAFSVDVLNAGTDTQVNLSGPVVLGGTVYVGTNAGSLVAACRSTRPAMTRWAT